MPEELTPLPEAGIIINAELQMVLGGYVKPQPFYSAGQMQDYARENRRAQPEPAASAAMGRLDDLCKIELHRIGEAIGYGRAQQLLGELWDAMLHADYGVASNRGRMGVTIDDAAPAEPAPSVAPEPPAFEATPDGNISDMDSRADVLLRIDGDFEDDAERAAYLATMVAKLNAAHPPRAPLTPTDEELTRLFFLCKNPDFTRTDTQTVQACIRMMRAAIEQAHGIGGKAPWVDSETGEQRVTPRPAPHKKPPPFAKGAAK